MYMQNVYAFCICFYTRAISEFRDKPARATGARIDGLGQNVRLPSHISGDTVNLIVMAIFCFIAAFMFLFLTALIAYKLGIVLPVLIDIFVFLIYLFVICISVLAFTMIVQCHRNVNRSKE